MPFRNLFDTIPEIYHPFLPEFFHQEIPPEPFSDCSACPMISTGTESRETEGSRPFSRETKCCTFTPRIPNYMVGGILSDPELALSGAKERILQRLASGEGVFPDGLYPSRSYNDYFIRHSETDFGRNKDLLCPYFNAGPFNCSIWKYREAICSFWYCKHLASTSGSGFWNSMIDYFKAIQDTLSEFAAAACGLSMVYPFSGNGASQINPGRTSAPENLDYSLSWGSWEGREADYYLRCFEIIRELSEFRAAELFSRAGNLLTLLEQKHEEFVQIPDYLLANRPLIRQVDESNYQVELSSFIQSTGSSVAWSFRLPSFLIDYFDGKRNTDEILGQIREQHGVLMEPEILIALYRHDILTDMSQSNKMIDN